MSASEAQLWLVDYLTERRCPIVETEYRFCTDRKWRFDVVAHGCDYRWAFEIEGGAWTSGRHTRGAGFTGDMEKYNRAASLGWQVFRFTPKQILDGTAKEFIEKYL